MIGSEQTLLSFCKLKIIIDDRFHIDIWGSYILAVRCFQPNIIILITTDCTRLTRKSKIAFLNAMANENSIT